MTTRRRVPTGFLWASGTLCILWVVGVPRVAWWVPLTPTTAVVTLYLILLLAVQAVSWRIRLEQKRAADQRVRLYGYKAAGGVRPPHTRWAKLRGIH